MDSTCNKALRRHLEVGGVDRVSFQFRGSCVNAVCCWDGRQCPHLRDMVSFQSDLYREVPLCVGI